MVWLIAKKEFHDNWISYRILLAFALCVILVTVSMVLALKDYSQRLSSYSLAHSGDGFFLDRIANYVFPNAEGSSNIGDILANGKREPSN